MTRIVVRNLDEKMATRLRVPANGNTLTRTEIADRARGVRARQKRHRSRAAALVRGARER